MRSILLFLASILCCIQLAQAQYTLSLEEMKLTSFTGLHSGVGVQWNGYWIFIGGRTNGLHGFRPPLAFPAKSANDEIWVIDVANDKKWVHSMKNWKVDLAQSLSSSNMQYCVKDGILYICGGYGWDAGLDDFNTFSLLSKVNLHQLVHRIKEGQSAESLFEYLKDDGLKICGGYMVAMGDTFSLVFGHEFVGHYSRHSGGFFKQAYSNEIRRFTLDSVAGFEINWVDADKDDDNFHRRDYNLVPQMSTSGLFYTAYSGVFQYDVNLPFYTPIEITNTEAVVVKDFEQRYSHYHSAVLPVYDKANGEMLTYFFGGMAEYYMDSATQKEVHDTLVPFVKTISLVSKSSGKSYEEQVLDVRMPAFMGSNMWFFPSEEVGYYHGKVLNARYIDGNTLVGYLVGGIVSPYDNINLSDPSISQACKRIYKVYLSNIPSNIPLKRSQLIGLSIYPNPSAGQVFISVEAKSNEDFKLEVTNYKGGVVNTWMGTGNKTVVWSPGDIAKGLYIVRVTVKGEVTEEKVVWE